jgi:uncharacterized membrane protein
VIYRFFIALGGAVVGVCMAFVLKLTVGGGIQLVPISAFAAPLIVGAAVGFVIGLSRHRITRTVLKVLSDLID